jgi:hypothetical protein
MSTHQTQPTLATLLAHLEELWGHFDTLLKPLTPADWQRKHGKDWRFADLPYHLAYFDRDIVATPIGKGANLPKAEQILQRTMGELDAWNARKFAQRPATQTVAQALAAMRASRDLVRQAVATFDDSDLAQRVWIELVGCGWMTVRDALVIDIVHTWGHLAEARIRLGKATPIPSPAIVHTGLGMFMGMMSMIMNTAQATGKTFTAHMCVNGPGGGDWTIRLINGVCRVSEERPAQADLRMTYRDADTFVKMMRKIANPMWLMLSGQVKVQGFGAMGTFGKLFAEPKPDQLLQPLAA